MSWEATAHVNGIRAGITRSEKLLLLVLANYHNKDRRAAWPSLKSLSEDGLISVRQASRVVNKLQKKGILTITPEGVRGLNVYRFVGLDVEPTIDEMSIVPDPPTIDISRTTIDISGTTIDIAMSTNPTIEPTIEPTIKKAGKKQSTPRKRSKPPDSRSSHPVIQALREITHCYPDEIIYDELIAMVGQQPDKARLKSCCVEWVGRGYKKTNYIGWVGWYLNGIPPRGAPHKAVTPGVNAGGRGFVQ